jgi:hypothetical protein
MEGHHERSCCTAVGRRALILTAEMLDEVCCSGLTPMSYLNHAISADDGICLVSRGDSTSCLLA